MASFLFNNLVEFLKMLFDIKDQQTPMQPVQNPIITMLNDIFQFIANVVTWTPEFFFNNTWIQTIVERFGMISIGLVTTLTMVEGIKRMLGMKHTPLGQILIRLPLALTVSYFAPVLFTKGAYYLNKLTNFIIQIGHSEMVKYTNFSLFGFLNNIILTLFVFGFLITSIPIMLNHGKRWFNLIALLIVAPLAMSAYLFDSLHGYYRMWLSKIQSLALTQLAYAVYITILAMVMAMPMEWTGGMIDPMKVIYTKLLVVIGGLWQMAFPPKFVRMESEDSPGALRKLAKTYGKVLPFFKK
jgi:hypothetical protein